MARPHQSRHLCRRKQLLGCAAALLSWRLSCTVERVFASRPAQQTHLSHASVVALKARGGERVDPVGRAPETIPEAARLYDRDSLVASTAEGLRVYNSTLDLLSEVLLEGAPPLGSIFSANLDATPPYLMPSLLHEANLIRPSNPATLSHFYDAVAALAPLRDFVPVGEREEGGVPLLQDYVAFGRMADLHPYDKLSCDWCSLINGASEYLVDLLAAFFRTEHFEPGKFQLSGVPSSTTFRWLLRFHHLVPNSASELHARDTPYDEADTTQSAIEALYAGCADAAERARIVELIRPVLEMCYFAEAQEQRWCPFRHASNVALRVRPYLALDSQRQEELDRALELLRSDGRVTCRSCAVELDRHMGDESGGGQISPKLRPYYDALLNLHARPGGEN